MAKLTREQANRWNAQAKNGFRFDVRFYVIWGDKKLFKRITTPDGGFVQYDLEYRDEYERVTNQYGVSWNKATGRHVPTLNVSTWHPTGTDGCYASSGLGKDFTVGAPQDKKNYKVLCDISATINIDDYKA